MVLTAQLRRRLGYHEHRTQSSSWAANSGTDYSGIVVSYTAKVATMLVLLCVDLGFNSSVDHDSPAGASGAMDSTALTFAMIYFGAQVRQAIRFCHVFMLVGRGSRGGVDRLARLGELSDCGLDDKIFAICSFFLLYLE